MFKLSFYDWCKINNLSSFLDRWDYRKNAIFPNNISYCDSKTKIFFKCEKGIHASELHRLSDVSRHRKIPRCSLCSSFGTWCEENNHLDFLKRWDYDKNKISPYEISVSSTKKMYFKCPKGIHDSELKDLNNMRKQYKSGVCRQCESIGQLLIDKFGENAIDMYWSDKNDESPFMISRFSTKKVWIRCTEKEYHDDYEVSCVNYYKGKGCPYCFGKRVSYNDSLGARYKNCINLWSKKNKNSPFNFLPHSNKIAWWICENNVHNDYKRTINNATIANFRCPQCSAIRKESLLQEKVRLYLESIFSIIKHEYNCSIIAKNPSTGYKLPYDNEVPELKLIIEVNGEQHYKESSYNHFKSNERTPKEMLQHRKYLDKIKRNFALESGYHFLEIPYWTDDNKETWKKLIDKKIESIAV